MDTVGEDTFKKEYVWPLKGDFSVKHRWVQKKPFLKLINPLGTLMSSVVKCFHPCSETSQLDLNT